jgi:hypothetical protein
VCKMAARYRYFLDTCFPGKGQGKHRGSTRLRARGRRRGDPSGRRKTHRRGPAARWRPF